MSTPVAPSGETTSTSDRIKSLESEFLLQNYARYPVVMHRGRGCYLYDVDGKRYLDLISGIGVNALGYAHPRMTKVMREQAGLLLHTSNLYFHEYQGALAERLARISGLRRTFFCNSGAEGMEGALKMIRSHGTKIQPDKYEVISLDNSFHGRTTGALAITGQPKYRKDFEPLLPGVRFVPMNDIAALEQTCSERTAGIVIEWIQGEGGVFPMSAEYAAKARGLADRYDALLVFDEIQCGVGRPGTYFAYQLADPVILPDIMVAAKPLACGLPLGVICMNERAAAAIRPGMHGSTFGGSALSCRVALEFFGILEGLLPSINRVGEYFRARLRELALRFPVITEVRGEGLMIGAQLSVPGAPVVAEAMKRGLLLNCTHETVLRFLPPYIITESDVDHAVAILSAALATLPAIP